MLPDNVNRDLPPLTAWQVESLRLTAFPGPTAKIRGQNWWSDAIGQPPETVVSRKGDLHAEGPLGVGKLVLRIQPTARIEWIFGPTVRQIQELENLPTIGSLPESLNLFLPLIRHWFELDTCPLIQRLAFGAVLVQPVGERQAGYRQIAPYLHWLQLDLDNSSDLIYQINRPRLSNSGIPELNINRLSKWGVAIYRQFTAPFEPAVPMTYLFPSEEYFACRLELDINTSQHFPRELEPEQIPVIFQELVDLGMEIAQKGDIP